MTSATKTRWSHWSPPTAMPCAEPRWETHDKETIVKFEFSKSQLPPFVIVRPQRPFSMRLCWNYAKIFSKFQLLPMLRRCLDGLLRARCPKGPQVERGTGLYNGGRLWWDFDKLSVDTSRYVKTHQDTSRYLAFLLLRPFSLEFRTLGSKCS